MYSLKPNGLEKALQYDHTPSGLLSLLFSFSLSLLSLYGGECTRPLANYKKEKDSGALLESHLVSNSESRPTPYPMTKVSPRTKSLRFAGEDILNFLIFSPKALLTFSL